MATREALARRGRRRGVTRDVPPPLRYLPSYVKNSLALIKMPTRRIILDEQRVTGLSEEIMRAVKINVSFEEINIVKKT